MPPLDLCLALLSLASLIVGFTYYVSLRAVEIDLKDYLGDLLVARDSSSDKLRVHFTAQVYALKTLISKHFKL